MTGSAPRSRFRRHDDRHATRSPVGSDRLRRRDSGWCCVLRRRVAHAVPPEEAGAETRLLEIGQAAADKALNDLIALGEFLETVGGNDVITAHTDERLPYLETVAGHLKDIKLAVSRIPDRGVRDCVKLLL